jgi:hypothetical protein
MKNCLLCVALLLGLTSSVFSQNKSLGVGTNTPNANAALHVESPTNNQGIIIPRLSTAQRSSFSGTLASGDIGLMVFDTDLRVLTIWNGTGWDIGLKTGEPIAAVNPSASGSAGSFIINNTGNNNPALIANTNGNSSAASLIVTQGTSTAPALTISHSGTGNAITANRPIEATSFIGDGSALTGISAALSLPFVGSSPTAGNTFDVTSTAASGSVARFVTNNAANSGDVVVATTNGTGNVLDISNTNAASVAAVLNISHAGNANGILSNRELNVNNTSTNTGGGSFTIANSGNSNAALFSSTNGAGFSVSAITTGTGPAGNIQIGNASNTQNVLNVQTNGTGRGINMILSNGGNSNPAININHSGTGNAITANRPIQATSFIGDGSQLANLIPSGIIMPYAGATAPGGYLVCDGAAVSRTTYAALFAAIGTNWGVGDGSTTFNLPDLRGRFLRGVDGAAGNDPDKATRTANNGGNVGNNVGSYQLDDFGNHTHNSNSPPPSGWRGPGAVGGTNVSDGHVNNTTTAITSSSGGNETRPKNAYVNYIIKF